MKKLILLYLSTLMAPLSAEIPPPSSLDSPSSESRVELTLSEKIRNGKHRGFDRLAPYKTACSLSDTEVATLFPQFEAKNAQKAYLAKISGSCRAPEDAEETLRGQKEICTLGGLDEGLKNTSRLKLDLSGLLDDEKPKLQGEAKIKFEQWKRAHGCFSDIEETKEIIRQEQILAEEVCMQKGLRSLPPYKIFQKMKDLSLFSDKSSPIKASRDGTIQIYSPEYKSYIADIFAGRRVLEVGSIHATKFGTTSVSTSASGGSSAGGSLSVTPVGVGGSISANINVETTKTETKNKPQNIDYEKIEQKAREIALKKPEITGFPPDYECTADACRNTSDNVWFKRSEAPEKMGCTPGTNCEPVPDLDEDAALNLCVDQKIYDYYEESARITHDPDYEFMSKTDTLTAEDQLKQGYCDEIHFGSEFCRDWHRKTFEVQGAPWLSEQLKQDFEMKKDLLHRAHTRVKEYRQSRDF